MTKILWLGEEENHNKYTEHWEIRVSLGGCTLLWALLGPIKLYGPTLRDPTNN